MSKTITVVTQKGGVGKTTTTNALAAGLKKKGFKVLAVDMDPQCNLSFSMGADFREGATIYHVLRNDVRIQYAIQRTAVCDILSSSPLLSGIEMEFTGKGRQTLLRQALTAIQQQYDYILIDSPPSLGILTANALVAADYVIVPTLLDGYSLQGLAQLYETIAYVKKNANPNLEVAGVLFTQAKKQRLAREMEEVAQMLCDSLQIPIFRTRIRTSVALAEAQNLQLNVMQSGRRANGVKDYMALVDELLERGI